MGEAVTWPPATYHWAGRTVDSEGNAISDWTSFGDNPESAEDVVVRLPAGIDTRVEIGTTDPAAQVRKVRRVGAWGRGQAPRTSADGDAAMALAGPGADPRLGVMGAALTKGRGAPFLNARRPHRNSNRSPKKLRGTSPWDKEKETCALNLDLIRPRGKGKVSS